MTLEQVGLAVLGLVDASQSGHAGKAVVTHASVSQWASKASAHPSTALRARRAHPASGKQLQELYLW